MAKKNRHKIVKGDKFPRIANYVLQIVLRMLIKPCKFLFSKTHEMVKHTPTNYALRIMHYELNSFRLASVDSPSLLHRISIVTPSKRWTIYGVSMEYVWSILGRKWGERWPLPRKEEAREPTKMLAK